MIRRRNKGNEKIREIAEKLLVDQITRGSDTSKVRTLAAWAIRTAKEITVALDAELKR